MDQTDRENGSNRSMQLKDQMDRAKTMQTNGEMSDWSVNHSRPHVANCRACRAESRRLQSILCTTAGKFVRVPELQEKCTSAGSVGNRPKSACIKLSQTSWVSRASNHRRPLQRTSAGLVGNCPSSACNSSKQFIGIIANGTDNIRKCGKPTARNRIPSTLSDTDDDGISYKLFGLVGNSSKINGINVVIDWRWQNTPAENGKIANNADVVNFVAIPNEYR